MEQLKILRKELELEMKNILDWWLNKGYDPVSKGFVGHIDHFGKVDESKPRGLILNARILWSLATGYQMTGKDLYLQHAQEQYEYLQTHFFDKQNGGYYYSITASGAVADSDKYVMANAYVIYAFSEYAKIDTAAAQLATTLLDKLIEETQRADNTFGERYSKDWNYLGNYNIHLAPHMHLAEALATLVVVAPSKTVSATILQLTDIVLDKLYEQAGWICLEKNSSLQAQNETVSFGHVIEASWLLQKATLLVNNDAAKILTEKRLLEIAEKCLSAIDSNKGGAFKEFDNGSKKFNREKPWWVQTEFAIGFFKVWQLTHDEKWLRHSMDTIQFIDDVMKDRKSGEWFTAVDEHNNVLTHEPQIGFWKCPYHNTRMCSEIITIITETKT